MATFNTRVAMNAGGSLARSRSRTCSSNMALSSNGGPGSRIRFRSRPSYFPLSHWPGALPLGLGSTTAPSITSACWWLFGVIVEPRAAKRSSSFLRSSGSRRSPTPRASATAWRVRSSSVGPSPPIKTMMSVRCKAFLATETRRSRLSPTMVWSTTSTPSRFRRTVRNRELVSWRKGVSNSEPMAMISAFTASSVNDQDEAGIRGRGRFLDHQGRGGVAREDNRNNAAGAEKSSAVQAGEDAQGEENLHRKEFAKNAKGREMANAECQVLNPLLRKQRQALNVPRKMMDRTGGGENHGPPRSEGEADQVVAGDFQRGLGVGSELHDAAFSRQRGRHIEVAINVEGEALGPAQAAIEVRHRAVRIDAVNGVEA